MSSDLRSVRASAPGKVILHGEYAVVFDRRAIAVSVDLRTTVRIEKDSMVRVSFKNLDFEHSWPVDQIQNCEFNSPLGSDLPELQSDKVSNLVPHNTRPAIDQAVRAFLYLYIGMAKKYSHWPVIRVEVESEFPPGAGLGSSAAFSVSLTAALFKIMTGDDPSSQTISAWAFRCEHLFHGKPSGIDNSICAYGGAILFQSGEVVEMLSGLRKLPALLVYTNVTRNTKVLVGAVSKLREKYPNTLSSIMAAMDDISGSSWNLMQNGKYEGDDVKELVTMNQHLLNALGAGHESIDRVVNIAKKRNLAAKLTGAGGGGCVIIHLSAEIGERETEDLQNELRSEGFQSWVLSFGGRGVTVESE